MSDKRNDPIHKLPGEILGYVFEFVVVRGPVSLEDDYIDDGTSERVLVKMAFRLLKVNRCFYSIAINTPSLWSNVSNKLPMPVLKWCMERSREHSLRVAVFLGEKLEDWFSEFLGTVISQASRWREFYFWTDRLVDYFVVQYPQLHLLDCGLHLPQLRTLELFYPFYNELSDTEYSPAMQEMINEYDATDARYHFYKKWTTPNLQSVKANELVPYHTEGSQIISCRISFPGPRNSMWNVRPLLPICPHWSKLRHLKLQYDGAESCAEKIALGATTLPSLETLSADIKFDEVEDFNHPVLNLLEFPNVSKVIIFVHISDFDRDIADERGVCCPLRDGLLYPHLSYFELQYQFHRYGRIYIRFDRRDADATSYLEVEFREMQNDIYGFSGKRYSRDQLIEDSNALSVACMKKLFHVIQRQPGWQNLAKMTVATESDDRFAFIQSALHVWDVQRQPVQDSKRGE